MKIAIDGMGAECGLGNIVQACSEALKQFDDIDTFVLVGDLYEINKIIAQLSLPKAILSRIAVEGSSGVVLMADKPSDVLRDQRDTSMLRTLQLLDCDDVDAALSCGNTGALIGLGRHILGVLPGIKRPAICAQLPTANSKSYLLDVGANVDCSAEQLVQFAHMGSSLVSALDPYSSNRVGVLSLGEEKGKGNRAVNESVRLIEQQGKINFGGRIEGDRLLTGEVEVIYCDGFVGNVALKSCEGTARYISALARKSFDLEINFNSGEGEPSLGNSAVSQRALITGLTEVIDPSKYNGACILGLKKVLVKSHGASSVRGVLAAIEKAVLIERGNIIEKIAATT